MAQQRCCVFFIDMNAKKLASLRKEMRRDPQKVADILQKDLENPQKGKKAAIVKGKHWSQTMKNKKGEKVSGGGHNFGVKMAAARKGKKSGLKNC